MHKKSSQAMVRSQIFTLILPLLFAMQQKRSGYAAVPIKTGSLNNASR
jgi:hypothetical protein